MSRDARKPGRCDLLLVAPHMDDAAFSCAGALLAARAAGKRALVAVLFSDPGGLPEANAYERRREEERASARAAGCEVVFAGLADAPGRGSEHRSFNGIVWGDGARDAELVAEIESRLAELAGEFEPAELIAPLGVGRHIDHRLVHEACFRFSRRSRGPRAWFYEDRPYALVSGATEARLHELGRGTAPEPGAFFASYLDAVYVRAHLRRVEERKRCLARWAELLEMPGGEAGSPPHRIVALDDPERAWEVVEPHASQIDAFLGGREGYLQACARAARGMGSPAPFAERQWAL